MAWSLAQSLLELILAVVQSTLAKLSSGFEKINYLFKWTAWKFIPSSLNGSPKLQFSSKGHILLEEITVDYANPLLRGCLVARNVRVRGLSTASLLSLRFDLASQEGLGFSCSVAVAELTVDCDYTVSGRLSPFRPLRHVGHLRLLIKRLTLDIKMTSRLKEVDGKRFLDVTEMKITPNIPHLQFELTEPGAEPQEDSFRVILNNAVWQRLYDAFFLHIEQEIAATIIAFVEQFTSKVPFCDIFILNR